MAPHQFTFQRKTSLPGKPAQGVVQIHAYVDQGGHVGIPRSRWWEFPPREAALGNAILSDCTMLLGVGRGKWVHIKGQNDQTPADLHYKLEDHTSKLMFNNAVVDVGTLIRDRHNTNPAHSKVYYHDMTETPQPGNPGAFTLHSRMDIVFRSTEQSASHPSVTIASGLLRCMKGALSLFCKG